MHQDTKDKKDKKDRKDINMLQDSNITEKIIGSAMTVHNEVGNGFQEVIYQRCLEIEMRNQGLDVIREFDMPIYYKGQHVGSRRVDFLVEGKVSVELKAVAALDDIHLAQGKNYLEAYNIQTGLLINFGGRKLEFKRLFNNKFKEIPAEKKNEYIPVDSRK
jgi:GxxExxY protein